MRKKGMTIVEVLIAGAIAAIALSTIYSFFAPGARTWAESQKRIEAQQSVMLGMNFFVRELELTTSGSVTVYPDISKGVYLTKNGAQTNFSGISYLSSRNINNELTYDSATGSPFWQKFHIIYMDDKSVLRSSKPRYLDKKIRDGCPSSPEICIISQEMLDPCALNEMKTEKDKNLRLVNEFGVELAFPYDVDPENDRIIARDISIFTPNLDGDTVSVFFESSKDAFGKTFKTALETKINTAFTKEGGAQ